jgi:dihydropyrimidinase
LQNQFVSKGKESVKYHAMSRPPELEALAVKRAIDLASKAKCQIYIVHVSAKESLDYIRKAQAEMQPVYAETCPQYLLFNDEKYQGNFEKSSPYVISPPLRKQEDIQELWHALADGTIQAIGTDHCPFNLVQKKQGMDDFRKIPNGAGGIEHRLELLYTYGVLKKKISITRFIELVSTMPAKIFGLSPKKGTIYKGSDADIVIWDPNVERVISAKNYHQNCDSNIYEGLKVHGQVRHVFSRGKHVIENAQLINEPKGFYLL